MTMYEYIKDIEKVLGYKKYRKSANKNPASNAQEVSPPQEIIENPPIKLDYKSMTKNQLVQLLLERSIRHNKRQPKAALIALLRKDDAK